MNKWFFSQKEFSCLSYWQNRRMKRILTFSKNMKCQIRKLKIVDFDFQKRYENENFVKFQIYVKILTMKHLTRN